MTAYLYAFILTAVAAVLVEMLAPSGEGGRLRSHVRLMAGLCMLVMLITPLREGLTLIRSIADGTLEWSWAEDAPTEESDYQNILEEGLSSLGQQEVAVWVKHTLEADFGIPPSNHTVTVTMVPAEGNALPAVAQVTILLHGASIFENPHQIEDYITDRLGCPCYVAIA